MLAEENIIKRKKDVLPSNIDLLLAGNSARFLVEKLKGHFFVELLQLLFPSWRVQRPLQELALLAVERSVARQHVVGAGLLTKHRGSCVTPGNTEVSWVIKDALGCLVGGKLDARVGVHRLVPAVVGLTAEVLHDFLVLFRNGHWVVCVDGVCLEVVGESTESKLVEDTALVDVQVMVALLPTPVSEVLRVLVGLWYY